jgi:hypothetical protein
VSGNARKAVVFSRMSSHLVLDSITIRPTSSVVAKRVGWLLKACTYYALVVLCRPDKMQTG